jgi:hypothetical protein
MTRGEAWLNHAANLLVGGTGLVYGWMLYLLESSDPFALVNHPLQPLAHAAHVVTAPLLVFGCGLLWRRHVWSRVRGGYPHRRKTGLALFALVVPMIASGYLLQVAVEEGLRAAWTWTHVGSSLAWIAVYVVHQVSPRPAAEPGELG